MSIQNLIIYQFTSFYKIFKEIENEFNFNIIEAIDNKTLKSATAVSDNYIIISKKNYSNIATQLIIEKFPISIFKIIERINIEFLKKNFNDQSQIKVKDYKIDINSRQIFLKINN
jgi:PKD repeat protein